MNKNSKRRIVKQWKANKAAGFKTPVFKKKAKPFPTPNKENTLSLMAQREIFYGLPRPL